MNNFPNRDLCVCVGGGGGGDVKVILDLSIYAKADLKNVTGVDV